MRCDHIFGSPDGVVTWWAKVEALAALFLESRLASQSVARCYALCCFEAEVAVATMQTQQWASQYVEMCRGGHIP